MLFVSLGRPCVCVVLLNSPVHYPLAFLALCPQHTQKPGQMTAWSNRPAFISTRLQHCWYGDQSCHKPGQDTRGPLGGTGRGSTTYIRYSKKPKLQMPARTRCMHITVFTQASAGRSEVCRHTRNDSQNANNPTTHPRTHQNTPRPCKHPAGALRNTFKSRPQMLTHTCQNSTCE